MDEARRAALIYCIKEHCKALAADRPQAIDSFANAIMIYDDNCRAVFGHSQDLGKLLSLKSKLEDCYTILTGLSEETTWRLNYAMPKTPYELHPWPDHLEIRPTEIDGRKTHTVHKHQKPSVTANLGLIKERTAALESLIKGIESLGDQPAFKQKATGKRNYRAAVAFYSCRKVWIEELNVYSSPCRDPEHCTGHHRCTQTPHCGFEAPWELHNDIPHPLADFVKDVFDVLGIGATVQSATTSLKNINGRNELPLSITNG